MKIDKSINILIVGLGLLGGSYAMSLKRQGYKVSAITKEQSSVDFAMEKGIIDYGTINVEPELVAKADLVIFALYPHVFIEWIEKNQALFKPGTVITDVTGVKDCVVYRVQDMLRKDVEFISAHPMAGREVYGVENSDDSIFQQANYIVVPTSKNTPRAVSLCRSLGETLGFAKISQISPEKHDEMIAFLSQLTHCIAISLMCANDSPALEHYTGDSFRDLTRIARINDEMWSELFIDNKEALLREMDAFMMEFSKLRNSLEKEDTETMRQMMRVSTIRRMRFDELI